MDNYDHIKKYLGQAFRMHHMIEASKRQLEKLRSLTTLSAPSFSGDNIRSTGGGTDKIGDIIASVVDLEREIEGRIEDYISVCKSVERTIQRIENERTRAIFTRRYLAFQSWETISSEMQIDMRWIYRIHAREIKKVTIENHHKPVI